MNVCDIAVIGGGAAGLTAAIFAGETCRAAAVPRPVRIVVLDGAGRLGAKILVSGGGRCNVTHDVVRPQDFNGPRTLVRNVLAAFDVSATRRWFASLGVELKREDTGKLFPVTDQARTVLAALLRRVAELGAEVHGRNRVHGVHRLESAGHARTAGFGIVASAGAWRAARVVMATGGRSLPRSGSDGGGWDIVRSLGHHVTDAYPALVPLVLRADMFHRDLSGVSQPVELSTYADGARVDRRDGSLLWTHFGVSGPVVMDASRHWVIAQARGQRVEMRCNFLPGCDFTQAERWLQGAATERPRLSLGRCLGKRLPERVALALARCAGCEPTTPMGQLSREQRRALIHALTAFVLPVERDRGWDFAEVTAGGVPLQEVDYRTMQSHLVPGLYLVGEMLDCDGRIGGFNFQWAWATGFLAGRAVARDALAAQSGGIGTGLP